MEPIIEVNNVHKTYRKASEEALKGVSLKIAPGEFFGLLGPNAAGKTTLISMICGLLKISAGTIRIKGFDIATSYSPVKPLIGLIPQEIALYPTLTVRENLMFFGDMYGISGKDLEHRVEECLDVVGLKPHAKKRVSICSGGIKRRANLVAGLMHKPEILFLDEPTLGVDTQSMNLIYEYLKKLNNEGTTIIYTTHYMKEAENLCSRINIIDDGVIISNGTPQALIAGTPGCSDLGQVFIKLTGRELRD
jgi:ABC-2 type transport system ATP-binding protein